MATLAKKSYHLINNIRSSNNTKIDSRNNDLKMFARTFNASWLNHSLLRGPRMLKQSNLYKELRANVCHPGHNERRYTKVSQSWLDAICGSMSCARPIHGQCRKQKHANSIQSLQKLPSSRPMAFGTQWRKSSAIAGCNARVAAWPIQGQLLVPGQSRVLHNHLNAAGCLNGHPPWLRGAT